MSQDVDDFQAESDLHVLQVVDEINNNPARMNAVQRLVEQKQKVLTDFAKKNPTKKGPRFNGAVKK